MARLNTVKSFRGTTKTADGTLRCENCGATISVGDPYRWWANRLPHSFGSSKHVRCFKDTCRPSQADMTPGRAGQLMRLQADGSDEISRAQSVEDLQSIAGSLAEQVRELGEELRESAQNIEDGFGHPTSTSEELEERAENIDGYADELESVDLDDWDGEDEARAEAEREYVFDNLPEEAQEVFGASDAMPEDPTELQTLMTLYDIDTGDAFEQAVEAAMEGPREEHLEGEREKVQEALDQVDLY